MKAARINIRTVNFYAAPHDLGAEGKSLSVLVDLEDHIERAIKEWAPDKATERFERSADGVTTTDHKSGLMWATTESEKRMTFAEAEAYAASLKLGGFDDWRLPDLEELESIRDLTRHQPCIDTDFFQSNSSWVWSRTPCAWSSDRAWIVGFSDGDVYHGHRDGAAFVRPVRAVSAGQ